MSLDRVGTRPKAERERVKLLTVRAWDKGIVYEPLVLDDGWINRVNPELAGILEGETIIQPRIQWIDEAINIEDDLLATDSVKWLA